MRINTMRNLQKGKVMGTHKELITALKFDESFKNAMRDYYNYGFKNLSHFTQSQQTVHDDWNRLNNVVSDYFEWSSWDERNKVMFANADSQSMEENPFHRMYRFCKYKPFTYPSYFIHTMAALSEAFKLREGLSGLIIDENSLMRLEDLANGEKGYKTSDLVNMFPKIEDEDEIDNAMLTGESNDLLLKIVEQITRAIGDELSGAEDGRKIRFHYSKTSTFSNEETAKQKGKEYTASPYCIRSFHNVLFLLARIDGKKNLRAFRLDHMSSVEIIEQQSEPLELEESILERFNSIVAADRHNNAVKALTERLDELDAYGFVCRYQSKGKKKKEAGDRWWSLSELTMGKILNTGINVDMDFERHLNSALEFFSKYYLFGEVGTFLLDRFSSGEVSPFRFKHEYFMQALNDFNIVDLLYAIENGKWCKIKYSHGIAGFKTELLCFPLEIRVSNMLGREFLMYYEPIHRSYTALRIEFIDSIMFYDDKRVKSILTQKGYHSSAESIDADIANARNSIQHSWGVATTKEQDGNAINSVVPHLVSLRIAYNPGTDYYITNRLNRECRFGIILEADENSQLKFSVNVSDDAELIPWMRSFYSRIISCDGMDTDSFSLDTDVENIVRILLDDSLNKLQKREKSPTVERWDFPTKINEALGDGTKAREHDKIFNEVFSIYYYIMADVFVRLCSDSSVESFSECEIDEIIVKSINKYSHRKGEKTKKILTSEIKELLKSCGFLEKTTKIVETRCSNGIFKAKEERIVSFLPRYTCESGIELYRDVVPISTSELRWLKTIIQDNKIRLFMSDAEIELVNNLLMQYAPDLSPFPMEKVKYFDRFHFPKENIGKKSKVFATILKSIYDRKTLHIKYHTMKNSIKIGEFRPIVIEFSRRNNRFQGYFQECDSNKIYIMNVSRVETADETETSFDYASVEKALRSYREENTTSVKIEFYDVHNIVDRILTEFSPWKKSCSFDRETNLYTLEIFYQKQDEVDLVVRLMGYGGNISFPDKKHPVYIEILNRMNHQMDLIRERRNRDKNKESDDNR